MGNEMGDHQMETYFRGYEGHGGMFCDGDNPASNLNYVFKKVEGIYNESFKQVGGTYTRREGEDNCLVRIAHNVFFKDHPPTQRKFADPKIPHHVTYAYKPGATI